MYTNGCCCFFFLQTPPISSLFRRHLRNAAAVRHSAKLNAKRCISALQASVWRIRNLLIFHVFGFIAKLTKISSENRTIGLKAHSPHTGMYTICEPHNYTNKCTKRTYKKNNNNNLVVRRCSAMVDNRVIAGLLQANVSQSGYPSAQI